VHSVIISFIERNFLPRLCQVYALRIPHVHPGCSSIPENTRLLSNRNGRTAAWLPAYAFFIFFLRLLAPLLLRTRL
jgi:hypothetical protein